MTIPNLPAAVWLSAIVGAVIIAAMFVGVIAFAIKRRAHIKLGNLVDIDADETPEPPK